MRIIILLFIGLFFSFSTRAQKQPVRYEALDSLSSIISGFATEANEQAYINAAGKITTLHFPKENFKVFYYNKLATKATYKDYGLTSTVSAIDGKFRDLNHSTLGVRKVDKSVAQSKVAEIGELTEHIDLAKATGITQEELNDKLLLVKVYFSKKELKTTVTTRNSATSEYKDYVEFFSRNSSNEYRLLDNINYLCGILKMDSGSLTRQKFMEDNADWQKLTPAAYLSKHPTSLRAMQARFIIKNSAAKQAALERLTKQLEIKKTTVIDSLCTVYKFKAGASKEEFSAYNEEAAQIIKLNHVKVDETSKARTYSVGKFKKNYHKGPFSARFDSNEQLISYDIILEVGNTNTIPYFSKIVEIIKQQFPEGYIKEHEDEYHIHTLQLSSPQSKTTILFRGYADYTQSYGLDGSNTDIIFSVK